MTSGIYKIQSKIKPNRIYIGSAVDIKRRWSNHLNDFKKGTHLNKKLQNHYNKYGKDDLVFSIIYEFEFKDRKQVNGIEDGFIKDYNPYFNICKSATHGRAGLKNSPKHRERISQSLNKKETKEKQRERMLGENNPNFGKPPSDETAQKISKSLKIFFQTEEGLRLAKEASDRNKGTKYHEGFKHSPETKEKMRLKKIGTKWAEGTYEKQRKAHLGHTHGFKKGQEPWNKGKKMSKEFCANVGNANKGRLPWNKGMKLPSPSDEVLKKRSESMKRTLALKQQNKVA